MAAHERTPCRRILVPVDGSAVAAAAIDHILTSERSTPLRILLLNVQPPIMSGDVTVLTTADMVQKRRKAAGERALKHAARALAASDIAYETEIAFGSPVQAIVRCAAARQCDEIVMATRNQGLLQSLLGRSVTQRVVKLARIPVTVVKAVAPRPLGADTRAAVATT
jgi:nucleotide-binding universal stress UspA family protein